MESNREKIQTFYPTWEEFKDFNTYILQLEEMGAHEAGICKIVPPKEWCPRRNRDFSNKSIGDYFIKSPILQKISRVREGAYVVTNVRQPGLTVEEFRNEAMSEHYFPPVKDDMSISDLEHFESKFWKGATYVHGIYGADVGLSLMDEDNDSWNIARLGSVLDYGLAKMGVQIPGVNSAYCYFGMWKTVFPWHTEDVDLYSINYLHHGAAKYWYAIPPKHAKRFEQLAHSCFPEEAKDCKAFLRHKRFCISPKMLKKYGIPFDRMIHNEGEIILTFPVGYHSGFNTGFNIAESTNFATKRWIDVGSRAVRCFCERDNVRIEMSLFAKAIKDLESEVGSLTPDKLEELRLNPDMIKPMDETQNSVVYESEGESESELLENLDLIEDDSEESLLDRNDKMYEPGSGRKRQCSHRRYPFTEKKSSDKNTNKERSSKKRKIKSEVTDSSPKVSDRSSEDKSAEKQRRNSQIREKLRQQTMEKQKLICDNDSVWDVEENEEAKQLTNTNSEAFQTNQNTRQNHPIPLPSSKSLSRSVANQLESKASNQQQAPFERSPNIPANIVQNFIASNASNQQLNYDNVYPQAQQAVSLNQAVYQQQSPSTSRSGRALLGNEISSQSTVMANSVAPPVDSPLMMQYNSQMMYDPAYVMQNALSNAQYQVGNANYHSVAYGQQLYNRVYYNQQQGANTQNFPK